MKEVPTTRIAAPAPELARLSLCETSPGALAEWIMGLPMANTAETAAQVRQATWEIARLDIGAEERMALLEQIRPILHYLCARLDRNAGSSSSQADSIARLAQRLQTNLCAGYKSVVVAALAQLHDEGRRDKPDRELLPLAIHRTLSDLSRTLLRTLQFYVAPAERLWLELNQLYLLAERLGVAGQKHEDAENHTTPLTSPMSAYLRSLLLAIGKPNQMRHRQLAEVFNCLEAWSEHVTLEPDATSSLFAVDLESDQGPVYKRLMRDAVEPRGIRTELLVYQIESYLRGMSSTLKVPEGMTTAQLRHLADAWGTMPARAHRRMDASGIVKVCVGLRSTHYVLSGGRELADLLDDPRDAPELNPFLLNTGQRGETPGVEAPVKDVWDEAFDVGGRIPPNPGIENPERILRVAEGRQGPAGDRQGPAADRQGPAADRHGHEIYEAIAIDTSPSGYQIRWMDPLPPHLQTGEILALRETADSRWCVAVIRWIRQDHDGTGMGIELLSPRAVPVAVRVIQKIGGPTSYSRALMLPELAPIGQPATLITPRMPFQTGQKVHIQERGVRSTAQLVKCVQKTESVNQFTYRMLSGYLENSNLGLKMGDL